MSFLFGSPRLPPVAPPPPAPEVTPGDEAGIIGERRETARKSRGRRSTLLTSSQGVLDRPSTLKPKLGGF